MKEACIGIIRQLKVTGHGCRNIEREIINLTVRIREETKRLSNCCKTKTFRWRQASTDTAAALPQLEVEGGAGLCRSSYWVDENDRIAGKCYARNSSFVDWMITRFCVQAILQ